MNKLSTFVLVFLLLSPIQSSDRIIPSVPIPASPARQEVPFDLLKSGIDLIVLGKYTSLEDFVNNLDETKRNLTKQFLILSMLYARMGELETTIDAGEFLDKAESLIYDAEERIRNNNTDLIAHFYLGSILCYRAVVKQRKGSIYGAWRDASRGKKELQACLEIDPEFNEPHLLLGSYRYWLSAKNFMRFLPFIADNREDAINQIRSNSDIDSFAYPMSLNQLIWIMNDFHKLEEAERIAKKALAMYPSSRFFLYPAAITAQKREKWDEAAVYFEKVKNSLESDRLDDRYMWLKVTVQLAESLMKIGDYKSAVVLSNDALSKKILAQELELSSDLLERAEKIERISTDRIK